MWVSDIGSGWRRAKGGVHVSGGLREPDAIFGGIQIVEVEQVPQRIRRRLQDLNVLRARIYLEELVPQSVGGVQIAICTQKSASMIILKSHVKIWYGRTSTPPNRTTQRRPILHKRIVQPGNRLVAERRRERDGIFVDLPALGIYAKDLVDEDHFAPESAVGASLEIARPRERRLEGVEGEAAIADLAFFEGGCGESVEREEGGEERESEKEHFCWRWVGIAGWGKR